jgi:transposase
MRCGLNDYKWAATGCCYGTSRLVYDMWTRLAVRRNSGAICRTALAHKPPAITRFVRWRIAEAWDQIMHALGVGARMVDWSTRPLCTCTTRGPESPPMENTDGWPRSGLSSKLHAVVDTNGLPVCLALTTGKALDNCLVLALLAGPEIGSDVACGSVDRGYDAEWIRALDGPHCTAHGQTSHRNEPRREWTFNGARNPVELFFNKIEQHRRVAIATSNSRQLPRRHSACSHPAKVAD